MNKPIKSIAFYVNGNDTCGLGHIYRVLQLANEFTKQSINIDIYFDTKQTKREFFGDTKHNLVTVEGTEGLIRKLKDKEYDILINDILQTNKEYVELLRESCPKMRIVNFEDDGEGAPYADLVINALYDGNCSDNIKSGIDYYMISEQFLKYEPISITNKVENILVTFGGADPMGYTNKVLEIAQKEKYKQIKFMFVVGRANKGFDKSLKIEEENIEVLYNINNMPEVMSRCDLAITSRGRTGYELAALGVPTISIAQNEREERHNFMSSSNGFKYIGYNPSKEVIEKAMKELIETSKNERETVQKKMLVHDLRNGTKRVVECITKLW